MSMNKRVGTTISNVCARIARKIAGTQATGQTPPFDKQALHAQTTASQPRHDDTYIVEFPKSGITWLSSIMANMALQSSNRGEVATFCSVHLHVPDIHATRDVGNVVYTVPPVRFIKSHAQFNPNYPFVIYLARHPVAVMKSYYRFAQVVTGDVGSFDEFCRSEKRGAAAWSRHVRSWLTGRPIAQRLHVCRYEDLMADTAGEIQAICENFGWRIEEQAIEQAIKLSSLENMKRSEATYRARNPRYSLQFVGSKADIDVSESTIAYIKTTCEPEMRLLGYIDD